MWTTVCVKQGTKREIMKVCNKNQPDGVMTGDPMRLGWLLYPSGVNPVLVLAARLVNTATDGTVTELHCQGKLYQVVSKMSDFNNPA